MSRFRKYPMTGIPWHSQWCFDRVSVQNFSVYPLVVFMPHSKTFPPFCTTYLDTLLIKIPCLCRHELTRTTKFYMHAMRIKGMRLSSGYCRQAMSLIGMFEQCCWGQILSSMNTRLLGNFKWISSSTRTMRTVANIVLISFWDSWT